MADLSYAEWLEATDFGAIQHPDSEFIRRCFKPGSCVEWDGRSYLARLGTSLLEIPPDLMVIWLRHQQREAASPDDVG